MDLKTHFPIIQLFILCIYLCRTDGQDAGLCTGVTPCYCTFENGQYLDLTPLGSKSGDPSFANVTDKHEMTYSWNPCYSFTEGDCKDVAICWKKMAFPHDMYRGIGLQKTGHFGMQRYPKEPIQLIYTTKGSGATPIRRSFISLICDTSMAQNETFTAIGERKQDSTDFYFELRGQRACPQGQPIKPSTAKPGSPGKSSTTETVLIVVGVLVVVAVVVSGAVFRLKKKGVICKQSTETYDAI